MPSSYVDWGEAGTGIGGAMRSLFADQTQNPHYQKAFNSSLGAQAQLGNMRVNLQKERRAGEEEQNRLNMAELFGASQGGVTLPDFRAFRQQQTTGVPATMMENLPPDVAGPPATVPKFNPDQTTKLMQALQHYAAISGGKPNEIGSYMSNMAKVPGEQATSDITRALADAFMKASGAGNPAGADPMIRSGQAALGRNVLTDKVPANVQTAQWMAQNPNDPAMKFLQQILARSGNNVNVFSGAHQGVDAAGNPVFFSTNKEGAPRVIEGVTPPPKPKTIDQVIADRVAPALEKKLAERDTPPLSALKEGKNTTFKNGQTWTLQDGKPVRVK